MTKSELKASVEKTGSFFFDRGSMKFFGDTMRNYGVRAQPEKIDTYSETGILCWVLYRAKPVKHGMTADAFFNVETFERVLPKKD